VAIGRLDIADETLTGSELSSEQLADALPATGEAVISLDGTSLSREELAEVRAALASEVPEDLK
jgi:hypothetical protein